MLSTPDPLSALRVGAARERPRISYLRHGYSGSPTGWLQILQQCQDLHFDHIALPPVFAAGPAADPFLAGDIKLANLQFGFGATVENSVEGIAKVSRAMGLRPIFDFVLDRVDGRGSIVDTYPQLFVSPSRSVADPRAERSSVEAAFARFDEPECREQLLTLWRGVLARILRAGAAGFRFLNVPSVPPEFLRRLLSDLRGQYPELLALAWTPGAKWCHYPSLEGVGLNGVFCSLPWWDFRAPWLFEEYDALRRVAPVLGCPDAPLGAGIATKSCQPHRLAHYRRSVRFAATAFDGLLLPLRFEGRLAKLLPECLNADEIEAGVGQEIIAANDLQAKLATFDVGGEIRNLTGTGASVTAVAKFDRRDARLSRRAFAILVNSSLNDSANADILLDPLPPYAGAPFEAVATSGDLKTALAPGEVRVVELQRTGFILPRRTNESQALKNALRAPRLAIERVRPVVDQGRFAVKRLIGETIDVTADVFSDGHGLLAADILWKAVDEREWHRAPMTMDHNDVWRGSFRPLRVGRHVFTIEVWSDSYATLCHAMAAKHKAGVDVSRERQEALETLGQALAKAEGPARAEVAAIHATGDTAAPLSGRTLSVMRMLGGRPFLLCHEPAIPVEVERPQAGIGAWYELFPRSASPSPGHHGTFMDVIERLPAIRAMGFDVLYFPPIHPIGGTHRKGRNNALTARPDDPGSCYAIGSPLGGHDAILPALGTFDDFIRLRDAAAEQGMELALDFAIQCSPDHPWLKQHPEWFRWEQDGSIRYAENPPKKYEDIVNVEFYAEPQAAADLWRGLRDIVLFWVDKGIRIFRVDNPHTKPLPFWEWMIADVRAKHPDVIFLSEAFTRPKMMYRLAKIGFSQSYTYFTWRNSKHELIEYLTELSTEPTVDFFRPNFFVNTPDINPYYLQTSGRPGFIIRAVMAATLSTLWGMYSGFELCESTPLPGREEYLDSEKYEIKSRDYTSPGNIIDEITRLNRIRKSNPELQSRGGLTFCPTHNDQVLAYARGLPERGELILVAVTLDPFRPHDVTFELPLKRLGLPTDGTVIVQDLLHDNRFSLTGAVQRLRLDPHDSPFAIWRLLPADGGGR
jgi:starch synthase (maltosyl-transferring)